jgi:hypothetical protein
MLAQRAALLQTRLRLRRRHCIATPTPKALSIDVGNMKTYYNGLQHSVAPRSAPFPPKPETSVRSIYSFEKADLLFNFVIYTCFGLDRSQKHIKLLFPPLHRVKNTIRQIEAYFNRLLTYKCCSYSLCRSFLPMPFWNILERLLPKTQIKQEYTQSINQNTKPRSSQRR